MAEQKEQTKLTLDKLKIGESATIKTVGGEGSLRLRFLDMGLIPGTKVKMLKRAPMGDPLDIIIRGYELTLRIEDARNIEIDMEITDVLKGENKK
ncbi:FeoA family protein [Ruminococcus sp.]|mgnify:CR=1 FL=1|uniref:FeoA family protein n=1 Tax=Ruminococcus sp. TaxID=41978 RepID=UPI0025FFF930|nr:FeoA family protein [Ruminococcus sp.]